MVKAIHESLYRWQKEGWTLEKIENDQFTLIHPKARPVICGLRTQFQTVGAVQGEMQRALHAGPKPQAVPEPVVEPTVMPKRTRKKPPKARFESVLPSEPVVVHRPSPFAVVRRRVAVAQTAIPKPREQMPFENAAWELTKLRLLALNTEPSVIAIMAERYQTDDTYRHTMIQRFRQTSQAEIQTLRAQFADQMAD